MKRLLLMLAVLGLLLTPVMASANTAMYPPDSTKNCWDDWKFVGNLLIPADDFASNPDPAPFTVGRGEFFGAQVTDGIRFEENGNAFFSFATSALGPNPGEVSLKLFDFPFRETPKNIKGEVYFIGQRSIESIKVDSYKTGDILIGSKIFEGSEYITPVDNGKQTFEFSIFPNPDFEVLTFILAGSCDWQVDKICVYTQCVPQTPIPGSLLLLGSGIIGLVGVGIRRRSA